MASAVVACFVPISWWMIQRWRRLNAMRRSLPALPLAAMVAIMWSCPGPHTRCGLRETVEKRGEFAASTSCSASALVCA